MKLKPGDEIEAGKVEGREIAAEKLDKREWALKVLEQFRWPVPEGYKFDREEANERPGRREILRDGSGAARED